jgi:hypothetical protein
MPGGPGRNVVALAALLVPASRRDAEGSTRQSSPGVLPSIIANGAHDAVEGMTRFLVLTLAGALAAAPRASAACQWFGTQLECHLGASRVVIGTQTAEEPTRAHALPIQSFHGDGTFPDMHAAPRHPFEIEVQDFGRDSTLCRRIGNEVYCY